MKAHTGSTGRYTLSFTSAVNATPRPIYLREKDQVPIVGEGGQPQGLSGRVRKISHPPGFNPLTEQVVASRNTDWAITAYPVLPVRYTRIT